MSAGGLPGVAAANPPAPAAEELRCQIFGAEAWVGARCLGAGNLYVAESRLAWLSDSQSAPGPAVQGFSLNYPAISLHGLAKTGGHDGRPHLYLLVRGDLGGDNSANGEGEADGDTDGEGRGDGNDYEGDDEDEEVNTEVRFYPPASPSSQEALMALFQAVSDCQALHPDAEDTDSDAPDEDGDDEDAEEGDGDYNGEEGDYGEGEDAVGWPSTGSGDQHQQQQPMDTDDQFEDAA